MAKQIDFSQYSRVELIEMQSAIQLEISAKEKEDLNKARELARQQAESLGFSFHDLFDQASAAPAGKNGKAPLPPKYRHPTMPDRTWSGRGRQPDWIKAHLEAGKDLEEIAI